MEGAITVKLSIKFIKERMKEELVRSRPETKQFTPLIRTVMAEAIQSVANAIESADSASSLNEICLTYWQMSIIEWAESL